MPLDHGAEQLDRRALGILDEEHRVRVADVDRDRIAQRPRLDAEVQRVRRLGQRDVAPVEADAPHVDADLAVDRRLGVEQPRRRSR